MTETTARNRNTKPVWPQGVSWRISLTWMALVFEAVWPRLWPATGVAGLFLLLALWDLWLYLPGIIHMGALAGFTLWLAVILWRSFSDFRLPTREQAIRRLETDNHLAHRPLSTFADQPAFNGENEETVSLWQRHRKDLAELIRTVRLHAPRSALPARDPKALRALLLLLLIPSFYVAGNDWQERISAAFAPDFSWSLNTPAPLEAWIDPPDYTGLAPIFLTAGSSRASQAGLIEVPANALLVTQTSQDAAPLQLRSSEKGLNWIDEEDTQKAARLEVSQRIQIKQRGRAVATWDFRVIPDRAPAITLSDPLSTTIRQTLEVPFAARDDYGIEEATIQFSLVDDSSNFIADDIISLPLSLPAKNPKRVDETGFLDLASHPWAGLPVHVELVAIDAIGQIGRSEPIETVLPERLFTHPMAKAIIEQRRNLALSPKSWEQVAMALDVLAITSGRVTDDYTLYLGLRSAYWSLLNRQPREMSEILDVYALLWDLALRLEDGDAAEAEQNMRTAQQALMDALAKGADPKTVDQLMQAYQKALSDYLKALAQQAMDNTRQSPDVPNAPANAKQLRAEDLQKLMQDIEDMIATGDTAGARELLAELQRMMENLATGKPTPMTPEQARLTEAIDGLSDILGRQRSLLDETFARRSNGTTQAPVEQENLPGVGETTPPSASGSPSPLQDLAGTQSGLGQDLGDLAGEIAGLAPGAEGLEGLKEALGAMSDAAQSLQENEGAAAEESQRRAIEALSQGANDLAEQLLQQMASSSQRQMGNNQDPLGRTPGSATSLGENVKVPSKRDLQRARDILEELQKRAGENERPLLELQYLERLLKRF